LLGCISGAFDFLDSKDFCGFFSTLMKKINRYNFNWNLEFYLSPCIEEFFVFYSWISFIILLPIFAQIMQSTKMRRGGGEGFLSPIFKI
jgi:hypothetical protein